MTDMQRKKKQEKEAAWILQLINQAQAHNYFGTITLTFDKGQIKRAQKEESLRPPD